MTFTLSDSPTNISKAEQKEVHNLVLSGLEQIKQSQTKDFDEVCDRLEKNTLL